MEHLLEDTWSFKLSILLPAKVLSFSFPFEFNVDSKKVDFLTNWGPLYVKLLPEDYLPLTHFLNFTSSFMIVWN